ncbi:uncharacterized protein SPAPADRAFT_62332 [Spathaspora passalidarum NRRL Y-27907]|uniref:SP-RING-type domain-containing protein n=1 Tax=Spathaspora passalidarum (strain NRRL Y-27907 / 11-Y1) TaxID=619300 RepID=G3ARC4_SPAPN|nr:uncharacterized protein SPAPADRAFT_62332 [Spathaspora passalidarum NRRL Y-27907]EGW31731.1 hypothetical protein SPAPADRAFT_62332 [Spathaspora passalidarum NRRL Y-27907]
MSDSEEEVPTMELKLPDYLPLKSELMRDFEKSFHNRTIPDIIKVQTRQIQEAAEKYIQYVLEHPQLDFDESILSSFEKSLENLIRSEFEFSKLEAIRKNPSVSAFASREESDLTLDSLESYQNITKPNFSDVIEEQYLEMKSPKYSKGYKDLIHKHKFYNYLNDILFVIRNPEDQIPDENEDEELNVSGGKISLKDPLSLNYYSDPVRSKRCKHTFERSNIEEQLKRGEASRERITHCPIAACSQVINRADLEADVLMIIRIRSFQRLHNKTRDVDTVI